MLPSRCTVVNVFCFFDYPKIFFYRERAITRSCSHSTWFALHSYMRVEIILFGGRAVPTFFQIMREPQFFFAKFRKKYAWNIRVYMVNVSCVWSMATHGSTVHTFLQEFSWEVLNHHPPYNPDLMHSDFHLRHWIQKSVPRHDYHIEAHKGSSQQRACNFILRIICTVQYNYFYTCLTSFSIWKLKKADVWIRARKKQYLVCA